MASFRVQRTFKAAEEAKVVDVGWLVIDERTGSGLLLVELPLGGTFRLVLEDGAEKGGERSTKTNR